METNTFQGSDLLNERSRLLTSRIGFLNEQLASLHATQRQLDSGKFYIQVKVIDSDSFAVVADIPIGALSAERDLFADIIRPILLERFHLYVEQRNAVETEYNDLRRQLAALGG